MRSPALRAGVINGKEMFVVLSDFRRAKVLFADDIAVWPVALFPTQTVRSGPQVWYREEQASCRSGEHLCRVRGQLSKED